VVIIAHGRRHRMSNTSAPIHLLQISFIVLVVPRALAFGSDADREMLPQILLGLECIILGFTWFYLLTAALMKRPPPRREWLTAAGMLVIVAASFAHRGPP
jgi:H+/Cl- antiporter ClcA